MHFPARRQLLAASCVVCLLLAGCHAFAQPPAAQPGPSDPNVVYGVADGVSLLMDIYRSDLPGPRPALMMIHGGGWTSGDKAGDRGAAPNFARAGIVCFSINYRMAPKYHFPVEVEDCCRAVRWLRAHAKDYNVDPDRIGAFGGSAGGHLSLMLGTIQPGDFQSPDDPNKALSAKVQCVVDLFGPSDFTGAPTLSEPGAHFVIGFIGATPQVAPDKYRDASPITHVTKDSAPTLMLHGDADNLVPLDQSQRIKAAFDKLGVENELIVVKKGGHGFGGADKADIDAAYKRAFEFLLTHLKPQAPPAPGM